MLWDPVPEYVYVVFLQEQSLTQQEGIMIVTMKYPCETGICPYIQMTVDFIILY